MRCAWQAYLNLLPHRIRSTVDRLGRDSLLELRLRLGQPSELVMLCGSRWLDDICTENDLNFCINAASNYSPWNAATVAQGYLTGPGGHRMGICGQATVKNGATTGITYVTSVCLRVARDFQGVAAKAADVKGSVLILGPPGSGKTTFLRDLIRQRSNASSEFISVVDEKGELFPRYQNKFCFDPGKRTDVLSGCSKTSGINAMLRNMGPTTIAVDEITAREDCLALQHVGWCGIQLLATAHAISPEDLKSRPIYKPLAESQLFDHYVVLHRDKSWTMERVVR